MYALLLCAVMTAPQPDETVRGSYDVVVYGGTSAGIGAAVQASRMGKSVIVVAPEVHLGGLTSGGLGWTDSGLKEAVGGLALEYYRRVKDHYDKPENWKQQKPEEYRLYHRKDDAIWAFEPHIAEQVFEELVAESKFPVDRNEWLDREKGVTKEGTKIVAIRTLSGKTYRGKVFIDATYEGDLMASAGVTFTVGREANSKYGETMNGVQTRRAVSHQFDNPVDPYVVPGDPSSGLLPRIHAGSPGVDGEADNRIQAYCFRMCLTDDDRNRIPFEKPSGYDPKQYELLGRYLRTGWDKVFNKFDPIPNHKTDTNNHGGFSTDNIGMNYDYPEASYERRREIIKEHELYQKGLMYYLANDPGVPEPTRTAMSRWGLPKDEFNDNGHWPHQIYVREARRMVTDFVMTERHLRAIEPTPEPIGMGSYNMDSHNVQRYVDANGHARNEGDIQVSPGGPYPISYRAIVPKAGECTNLLVPVCLSSSHIAYGSIRMEPVFLILGQSAATAAAAAIDAGTDVQKVDYAPLQRRLLADHQVLDLPRPASQGRSAQSLPGVVVDDEAAELTGNWSFSSVVGPFVGTGYRHDGNTDKGKKSAIFRAKLEPGRYIVRVAYTANNNRASAIPVRIHHANGIASVTLDQKKVPSKSDAPFVPVGTFDLDDKAAVEILNEGTTGHIVIDAVQFLKANH
ncbi:FAD-dependent oxidoreductase [Singulisphaera sp. Ch08]|uniref:FAD-dependent oxidoreductase n=1 Tax=Singulisphaera sp. Ch08 TaxID=3120278 RepID=A0AAU7C8B6_9BACT